MKLLLHGEAGNGTAARGQVGRCTAWSGKAGQGLFNAILNSWSGKAWLCMVRLGVVGYGFARQGRD